MKDKRSQSECGLLKQQGMWARESRLPDPLHQHSHQPNTPSDPRWHHMEQNSPAELRPKHRSTDQGISGGCSTALASQTSCTPELFWVSSTWVLVLSALEPLPSALLPCPASYFPHQSFLSVSNLHGEFPRWTFLSLLPSTPTVLKWGISIDYLHF